MSNAEAAKQGPVVILTVPFRAQSENLTNLKDSLESGQLLVDCTVPLAAAVSGKATRTLGVWQGSAAQQAQEMVPDGVTVVAAFHTVGAPELADRESILDEDVLICGEKKADKAKVAALVEAIPGLRAVNAGPLEMARIVEAAHAASDLDQRPLQGPRGHPGHRPARRRPLGVTPPRSVAILAGGTGGAKLAAGMHTLLGYRRCGHREHRRRLRGSRPPRLARPRPLHLLARRPHRRGAGLGHRGRRLRGPRAADRARRSGLVRPLGPRPRDLPLSHPFHGRGRHAHRRPIADRERTWRPRPRPADVRRAGADARCRPPPDGAAFRSSSSSTRERPRSKASRSMAWPRHVPRPRCSPPSPSQT